MHLGGTDNYRSLPCDALDLRQDLQPILIRQSKIKNDRIILKAFYGMQCIFACVDSITTAKPASRKLAPVLSASFSLSSM